MAKTYTTIKTVSYQIKNATTSGANTAAIVGGNLGDILDKVQEVDSAKVPLTRTVNGEALTGDIVLDKADIGLGNVDNTSDADKPVSNATSTLVSNHTSRIDNPHGVTKAQVGLSNVDNTSDAEKPISTAAGAALGNKADLVSGEVPLEQLPEELDDVLQYANTESFPAVGESGKLYIDAQYNLSYRWSGTAYVGVGRSTATQITNTPAGTISATTVQAAINELDADLVQLGTDLNKMFNSFVFVGNDLAAGISYINDYYIGNIGQLYSFVGYRTTDFIFIKGQSQVEYIGAGHQSSVATCFYDSNKTFISSIVAHGNTTINVPPNAYYLKTSSNKSTLPYVQILAKQDSDISAYFNSEVLNSISKLNAIGIELIRMHDKNLVFSGFVSTISSTPSYSVNKAYIAIESGAIFGITNVQKGQVIIDNGTSFSVQPIKSLIDYYTKTQIDQFFNNFNLLYTLEGTNAALNTIYTLGYITSIGGILTHTIYEYTDYIQILGQDTVTVSGHTTNGATYLCFYDKNKSFIAGSSYAGNAANAILTVPTDAYYLRGTVAVRGSRLSVILNKNVDIVALKYQEKLSVGSQQIEDSIALTNSINKTLDLNYISQNLMSGLSLITNFYIAYDGVKIAHGLESYQISPTIKLNNIKKIRYKGYLSNNIAVGFYSSDVISAVNLVGIIKSSDQADDYTIDINVPAGAKYMVASTYTGSITTLMLEILELYLPSTYNVIDEQVKENTSDISALKSYNMSMIPYFVREYCRHIFNSIICIGDSITQGWRSTGVFPNESYPTYLSKITGWTVENSGVGGYTPISWYNNKFSLYNYTNFDFAIICLGQNEGLTDTIDTDTASGDYNTYANTNTGQYCRIIEAIKAAHPDIKMMLLTRMDNGVNVTWNVVYKIGLKYNIPVVSFVTNGIDNLTKTEYHPHSDTVHFGTIGNLAIANVVSKSIQKYVYDNMNDYSTYKE